LSTTRDVIAGYGVFEIAICVAGRYQFASVQRAGIYSPTRVCGLTCAGFARASDLRRG
jgi:hypothetical protein